MTFDLYIDVKKLWGGGGGGDGWVYLDYSISSGPFLSYEIEIGDGPGPELDNFLTKLAVYSKPSPMCAVKSNQILSWVDATICSTNSYFDQY